MPELKFSKGPMISTQRGKVRFEANLSTGEFLSTFPAFLYYNAKLTSKSIYFNSYAWIVNIG